MKSIAHQINAMKKRWPDFTNTQPTSSSVVWFGDLVGIQKPYRIMIDYDLRRAEAAIGLPQFVPMVTVLSPKLRPNSEAIEEAPLPHVYFDQKEICNSRLCLFDPAANEWSPKQLVADTIVPWTAEWLASYEGWQATGRWYSGGRHAQPLAQEA